MNIVLLSAQMPSSSDSAGCPRLHHLFSHLATRHSISLITSAHLPLPQSTTQHSFFDNIIPLSPPKKPTWWRKQLHRFVFAPHLLQTYRNPWYVKRTTKVIRDTLMRLDADILYIHGLEMSQYRPLGIRSATVVDFVDSVGLLYRRKAAQERSLVNKVIFSIESIVLTRWEAAVASTVNTTITISSVDRDAIKKHTPSTHIEVVPNGVDCEYFSPSETPNEVEAIAFTGVMSYEPNAQAVIWFANEVWPNLRKTWPNLEFWIIGMNPKENVRSLAKQDGIKVTGTVNDIRPYLEKCKIFVSPLQFGAGMKNKLLNAMAMRMPIIATPLSVEGIEVENNKHVLLAQSSSQWVKCITQLLEDPEKKKKLATAGYELARKHYSWHSATQTLEEILENTIKARFS